MNLKEFFSDLKERISYPFVSSFVISWIFWNYKIVTPMSIYMIKTDPEFKKHKKAIYPQLDSY